MPQLCQRLFRPVALTMCATLSTSLAQAAGGPSAVSEAYVGTMTQAKHDAALNGLEALTSRLSLLPGGCYGVVATLVTPGIPFSVAGLEYSGTIATEIEAATDQELGEPGAAVTLDGTLLRALATFSTGRDFIIGVNDGHIDTNGHDLTITGDLEAWGEFTKRGNGTLTLAGDSQWHGHQVMVYGGLLRGDSGSLQTLIHNQAAVEFQQLEDGVYGSGLSGEGRFRKTGSGELTITGANTLTGEVFIDEGRLFLTAAGELGPNPAVTIASGAALDLSATVGDRSIGPLSGNGELVLGQQLNVVADQDSAFAGVISGTGELAKTGQGTLSLGGENTFSGGTMVAAGTLALVDAGRLNPTAPLSLNVGTFDISGADGDREIGSLTGEESAIHLGANTLTVGGNNRGSGFSGQITGSGGLVKTGSGTLTLEGSNSYSGVTTILEGTLAGQAASLGSRIENDATLVLYENTATFPSMTANDGGITGSGQLVKEGGGMIWLRGENAYHGGTTVNDGVLIGNTDSLNGEISNHQLLAFYQVADGTQSGRIDGYGTLLAYGPGTLTLAGANTYTGGTAFSTTLQVADDANLGDAGGGLLLVGGRLRIGQDFTTSRAIALADLEGALSTFDSNGFDLTLAGPISGPGSLLKEGDGTLILAGESTFAGTAEARSGRLAVEGPLAGDLRIGPGAEAGGGGFIGGSLSNHGRLARGETIGPIIVAGNVTFAPGSLFTVKADPNGNADHLLLTGADSCAVLLGGTVEVQAIAGSYRYDTDYTILTAPGGIDGEFATVTANLPFLTPSLDYGPTSVELSLTRNDTPYDSVATSDDQRAVARVLGGLQGSNGDLGEVMDQLNALPAAEACQAFDSIAGRERAALPQVNLLKQRALAQTAVSRLAKVAARDSQGAPGTTEAGGQPRLAANEVVMSDAPPLYALAGHPHEAGDDGAPELASGLWMQGLGGVGEIDANAPGQDYAYTLAGVALGLDRAVGSKATLGLLGGYSRPRLEQGPNLTQTDSTQIGAYGSYRQGAMDADLVVTVSQDRAEGSRQVTVGGLTRQAVADYDGHGSAITTELSYTLPTRAMTLQPLIGWQWSRQRSEAYTETGAGGLGLAVPEETSKSCRSTLGLKAGRLPAKGETGLAVGGRIGWSHEFRKPETIGASLSGDPSGTLFSLTGVDIPRDSAQLGLGLAYTTEPALRLSLDLDSECNEARQEYTLIAGVGYRW